jgi:hypothetical protein
MQDSIMIGLKVIISVLMWIGAALVYFAVKQTRSKITQEHIAKINLEKAMRFQKGMKGVVVFGVVMVSYAILRISIEIGLQSYYLSKDGNLTNDTIIMAVGNAIYPDGLPVLLTATGGFFAGYMLFNHAKFIVDKCITSNSKPSA